MVIRPAVAVQDLRWTDADLCTAVVDSLTEGVVVLDPSGQALAFNDAVPRMLRLSPDELREGNAFDPRWNVIDLDGNPVPATEWPPLRALREERPQRGAVLGFDRADGTWVWVTGNAVPLRRTPDEPPWAVVYTFTDVTEQVEQVRRSRQLFDAAPAGIAVVGLDGVVQEANRATGRLLGQDPELLVGRCFNELVHAEDRPMDAAALARLIAGTEASHQLDLRLLATDGQEIWTAVRRSLVRDGAGRPAYVVAHVVDVGARYTLVETLRDELATLDEANVALAEFASRAAHDVKSPLMAIGGFANTLRDRWSELDESTRRELLDRVTAATSRAAAMVTELLAEAHRSGSSGDAVAEPLAALDNAVDTLGLDRAGLTVTGDWRPVAMATADLVSAFANVVDNAHHYGRGAGGALDLRVHAQVVSGVLLVECADSGPGLPDPERVFEPFYRGPRSREGNPNSTGLGLALVRRAVERWGGTASGGTSATGGAVIRLALPLA